MQGKYKAAYRRMFKIDELIREGRYPSAGQIAKKVGASKRTIFRDLRFMDIEMGAPIIFDEEHGGYCYTNPKFALSDFAFTDSDVAMLTLSKRILESLFAGTFYKSKISEAFESIVDHAGNMPEILSHTVRSDIEIALPNAGNFQHAETILGAMKERLCVVAVKDGTETLVRPIRLIYAWNDWYLLYITEGYKDNADFRIEKLDSFGAFKQTGKAASQKIPDITQNVDEWKSPVNAKYSSIEQTAEYGEVLSVVIQGRADTFRLLYKRNADGTLEFIRNKDTMLGGHVMETLLEMMDDVKINI